jgi:hypothetical protein
VLEWPLLHVAEESKFQSPKGLHDKFTKYTSHILYSLCSTFAPHPTSKFFLTKTHLTMVTYWVTAQCMLSGKCMLSGDGSLWRQGQFLQELSFNQSGTWPPIRVEIPLWVYGAFRSARSCLSVRTRELCTAVLRKWGMRTWVAGHTALC